MAAEKITKTTLGRLRQLANRNGDMVEVRDLVQPGLSIRLTGLRLTWYFRYSTAKLGPHGHAVRTAEPICTVDACADPEKMRTVVAAGKAALRDGRDPMAAARTTLAAILQLPDTRVKSADPAVPVLSTWDFATMREQFRIDPPDWLREETIKGYCRAMSPFQVGDLNKKFLVEISADDIRAVRSAIERRGNSRQANLTVQAIKSAFEWATEDEQSQKSGLTAATNPAAEVSNRKRRKKKRTTADAIKAAEKVKIDDAGDLIINDPSLPTQEDIGLLLGLLLVPGNLPLIKRAVLLLLVFSVQRRYTVACALRKVVLTYRSAACGVWVLDGGTTKGGLPHILPFSEIAAAVIEEWKLTLPAHGDWLFAGIPTKAKPRPSGHINVRTINAWLEAAWTQAGASRVYSPHKLRKAFQSYLSKLGVNLSDRKLIVDHTEGRDNDVTEEHYNLDPRFKEKLRVINIWNGVLKDCFDKAMQTTSSPVKIMTKSNQIKIEPTSQRDVRMEEMPRDPINTSPVETPLEEIKENSKADALSTSSIIVKARSTDPARIETMRKRLEERANIDLAMEQARKAQ